MVAGKAAAAGVVLLVISAWAAWDAWRNRRKYRIRENKRTAEGGLD